MKFWGTLLLIPFFYNFFFLHVHSFHFSPCDNFYRFWYFFYFPPLNFLMHYLTCITKSNVPLRPLYGLQRVSEEWCLLGSVMAPEEISWGEVPSPHPSSSLGVLLLGIHECLWPWGWSEPVSWVPLGKNPVCVCICSVIILVHAVTISPMGTPNLSPVKCLWHIIVITPVVG